MPENAHTQYRVHAKVYEMKTKSKKHKNMIETYTSAQIIYDTATTDHFYRFILW